MCVEKYDVCKTDLFNVCGGDAQINGHLRNIKI